jgi:hypothetical protein
MPPRAVWTRHQPTADEIFGLADVEGFALYLLRE